MMEQMIDGLRKAGLRIPAQPAAGRMIRAASPRAPVRIR